MLSLLLHYSNRRTASKRSATGTHRSRRRLHLEPLEDRMMLSASPWTELSKLTASDAAIADRFGSSVAISGDTLVVAATFDDDVGQQSGSAYVFERSSAGWTQQAKLIAATWIILELLEGGS